MRAFSEVMDDAIFRTVIAPADVLIASMAATWSRRWCPSRSTVSTATASTRSVALGRAFGLPYLVASRHSPVASAAPPAPQPRRRASPASLPNRQLGLLTDPKQLMVDGIENALRRWACSRARCGVTNVARDGQFTVVRSPAEGMWYPSVEVGAHVREGQNIGRIGNLYGDTLAEISALRRRGALMPVPRDAARRADDRRRRDMGAMPRHEPVFDILIAPG